MTDKDPITPSTLFEQPVSVWIEDVGPVYLLAYVGYGKFEGINEFGVKGVYPWE